MGLVPNNPKNPPPPPPLNLLRIIRAFVLSRTQTAHAVAFSNGRDMFLTKCLSMIKHRNSENENGPNRKLNVGSFAAFLCLVH